MYVFSRIHRLITAALIVSCSFVPVVCKGQNRNSAENKHR